MGEFTGCTELLGVGHLAGYGGLLGMVGPGTAGDCGEFCGEPLEQFHAGLSPPSNHFAMNLLRAPPA